MALLKKSKKPKKIRLPGKRGLTPGQMYFLVGFFGLILVGIAVFLSYPHVKRWWAFRGWSYSHRIVNTTLSDEDKGKLEQSVSLIRGARKDITETRLARLKNLHPDAVAHLATLVLDVVNDKEKALPYIKEKMEAKKDREVKVRQSALAAYAYMDDLKSVLAKAALLANDSDPDIRASACEILGSLEDKTAFEPLANAHGDAVPSVRACASSALIQLIRSKDNADLIPEIIKSALPTATGDKRETLKETLVTLGDFAGQSDPALVPLGEATVKACIQGFEGEGDAPKSCGEVLVRIGGPTTIPMLKDALIGAEGGPWATRTLATMDHARDVLVQFKAKSIMVLIEALKANKSTRASDVRTRAVGALVKLATEGKEETVPRHLVAELHSLTENAAFDAAIDAIKKIGEQALDEVYGGLDTEDAKVRDRLLQILLDSELRPKVLAFFERGLQAREDRIRMMSEQGLLKLGQVSIPTLEGCLKSTNDSLRIESLLLLRELLDFIADPLMRRIVRLVHDPTPRVQELASEITVKFGARAVPVLLKEVKDEGASLIYVARDKQLIEKITAVQIPEKYKGYTDAEKRVIFIQLVEEWIQRNAPASAPPAP